MLVENNNESSIRLDSRDIRVSMEAVILIRLIPNSGYFIKKMVQRKEKE
jgi:hypothetical protein